MAERPLYTLYKNLKAQNYDVPNDYNKFESALTRDGKSGANNRHAIYENLKAQNFDVPDTYERFYTALFEPRSKTSSRAKGGSVPMSAADRARFLSGAAAISASAKQIANNAGRYNRLKQRKQKQQKDFGRVNLGTHLTPFGGDANDVVKDEFAYNPETGKAGAYVTSDNENAYTQSDAEQKQAILDKYGEEWNKAVDMGMVPSELDKADPDMSDTDVAMRQMERRQEWLDENQNRRSKELNESMHLQDSPFVASGGAVAPSSFNAAIGNEANRLSDAEYGAYNTAKAYNQMLRTTLLQELKEQKQRNEDAGWWKDKWNDVSNYFGAMFNTMLDPKLYSQGVMDAAIASNLRQVKKGMEDGTIKKGSNAGEAAQVMLSAIQQQQGEAAKQQQNGTKAYQYGDVSGRSLKFMGDFALSGWRDVMTTGFTKAGEKVGEKMALGALGKWFTKNTGRVLGDMAGSAALAATNQLGSTYNNVIERYVGMNNENGGVTQDKDGDLKFNEGVSLGKAIKDGFGSATIENFSEMFGEYLPGASKLLSKLGLSKVSSFFEKIGNNAYYKWLSNATNKSGIQGVMSEIAEEEFGTALHAAWGDGDGSWSDFNVFTNPNAREKQIDTCLGMFYSVGFMQSPRTAVGAINAVKYFHIKLQVTKADKFGQMMFNDKWDDIKSKIDVTTNADLTKTVLDATRSDSMTAKQKGAVINYAMFLSKLRGFNQASDAKTKDKVEEGETVPTLSNYLDDAYTEGHNADDADKHDIQIQHEDQSKTLATALNISEQQLSGMSDEELESLTGQDDKLDQAIYDYQLSTARYQGVVDDAQDKVDLAAHQAEQRVNMYTDQSRGSVRNATIKASGGAEDYGVYIISGNIATHEDGSIDVSNSDDMILYFDPTTNSVEHADALMFAELGEELPADEVKAQAVADAKENAIKEVAGIIDGTVEVGSQFNVTDADGTEHTYEVLADNGDGTAMITIDGNIPTELVNGENVNIPVSFEELQKMKDEADQQRLQAAKAQREQIEKERAEQQMQSQTTQAENPAHEDNIQSAPIEDNIDYSDIIREDGKVQMVDVFDKYGNNLFPDAKDVFYIQGNKMRTKFAYIDANGELKTQSFPTGFVKIKTRGEVSVDDYKKYRTTILAAETSAMPESSMIEDNSGGNRGEMEVEAPTIEGEADGPAEETATPESTEDSAAEQTPATEQTPAITLEDGTIVPMLEDGNPDFSKLSAAQTAELYDSQFGEDADGIVSGYVSDAKKALDKANNMTVKGKTFVEQKAAKDAKEKAIADAQAAYDSAIAIRDAYNERQLAKEENTPEGRKSLIEKARRKYARLKNSEEWSERTGDLWNETVGKLLHRLYDATGIDVFDDTPNTVYEYVASNVGPYSLNYEGNDNSKGVQQETGLSRSDFAKLGWLAAEGKGMTIDAKVHRLWENRPSNLESADTQDIRNALISLITSGQTAFQARDYIMNQRIELAESALEEQLRHEEDAAEAQRAKEEEEKKKAELEKKKAEEEKTNENRNAPELSHEQQKAKEEGEKLGFPAVDKEGEPINQNVIELANWAKEQGLEIDPTSKLNSYADLYVMCKDGFGVSTLVPDVGENINQVFYLPDNVQGEQLLKLQEEFNVGRDLKHSADMNSEITEGAMFYDGDTAREFKEFVDKKVEKQNKVFGEQRPEEDLPFSAKDNGQQQTTSERAADVEKNKVDDMKVVDNIVGQKTRKAFDRLAKMMGAEIQWQYSDKLGNGWIQETKDADGNVHRTIFITLDSSITEGAQFIFGHEMTHQIKNLNPAAYNELTQLVLDTYGSDAFDKAVDETMKRYSDAGFSGRNRDYYAEEVVADAVGEMIRDLNLAHTLAMKMSHPLLAAIHEILQKIKLAFYGTEYSDATKNIIRSIEQAYVKAAKGRVENSETGEDVSFSLRQKPEPKKKGIGYKVFVLKDGKLYPPMVANPDGAATPVGVWLDADAAPIAGESKTGRPQVKQGGKGTQGGSGKLAYRPGWHLGVVPYAIQFNRKDAEGNKTLFPKNFVFAEVEYAADVDYQEEARQEGINPSGKYQHSLAGLKHLPTDGYYMYRTNPNPETDPWVITGAMKVNRILTRAEQADLVSKAGREPQQIQEGDIVTDDVVNSINQEIADAPKFSLKVYHGSGADFTEFDFDHMSEGAGSQAFGWGGYVTSSEEIGKSYAELTRKKPTYVYNGKEMSEDYLRSVLLDKVGIDNANILDDFLYNLEKYGVSEAKSILRKGDYAYFKDLLKGTSGSARSGYQNKVDAAELILALRNIRVKKYKGNLYEVDIPDNNGSNYLDFENPMNEEQINTIRDALVKNGVDVSSWENRGFKLDLPFKDVYAAVLPMMMRCEPKEVSKFLSSLGFTGIKYPAGTIQGGAEEGDTNYVIFKPEDMKITQHTKFSLRLKSAIEDTETNPSDAQKESGNYKKGHIKFGGYDYTIENPKGSTRSGKDANGKEWKVIMHDTYGYIRGKFGKDGDHLDMFINDKADLDNWNGDVFVVDQVNPDGSFDEHKVMYGYDSMDDAKKAYLANYSDGWQGLGNITGASKDEFDKWLDTSNRKLKPFADYANVKFSLKDNQGNPLNQDGTLKLDKIKSVDELTDEDFLHPTRNVELPSLPNKISDAIGTEGKPVVIKKNIFERNYMRHKDVTPELSKTIFKSALYNTDLYGQNQKKTRPYNWVLINTKDEKGNNRTVLLEVNPNKDNVEIVHWHFVDERGLEKIKKQADREDGQLLILPSDKEEVGALSDPTVNLSAAKIDNSSETAKENGEKFSLKYEKTLAGVHNITEEKLLKAIKQGGLANPSVAVIDSSKQNHEDYGDISLILPSDKVAKRTGKNAGTWQGDAWTPTYPQVERQMSNKGAAKASKDVSSVPGDMYREVRRGLDRWLDGGEANSTMAYMFLHEKGLAPEPKKIQHKFGDDVYNELKLITAGDFNIYGIGKADAQKVLDMYIDAKFDGDKDLYEEKTKAWLERNKSIVDAGNKGGMRYTIAKDNVELYDEYGFNYKSVQTFVRDVEYDHRKTGVDTNATLNDVEDYIKTNNLTDEFNTWLEGKEKEYGIKEVIFDGFTPSGNRRYVPNTLENVSKIMKKQGRNGATGISVSFQNFAASLMPSYGTLKDIRSKKGLLTSDHEDLDKFNEKWSNVFFELGMKCQPDATGTFDDYGLARLSEAAKTSDPQAYLKKEYNVDFSDEDTKRLKEMVKAIKEESPAMYFETKFERPVGFNEFSSAVVPTTASDEVKQALQNAGVQIYEYDKNKEGDRSRAFNEAINSSDNIRFSLKQTNDKFNSDLKSYVENGVLPENSRFELGFPSDILLSAGFPKLPISMRVSLLNKKAGMERHPFSPTDLYNLVDAIQEPLAIFEYTKPNMRNLIVDLTKGEKHFLVGVTLDYRKGDLAVNSISGLFPKENHEWIKWIQDGKAIRIDKKDKVLSLIDSLRTNPEEAERIGLNLDFAAKIIKYFENPSVSSENTLSDTKFSLRGSTTYDKQMEEWMEKNHLEKGAVPMEKPTMKEGENIFDYANRIVEWTRNQNLWKTAPKHTGFQDVLDKWKADNSLSPDAYPPVRPHREYYSSEIGYAEDLEEYNKKKELWKSAPKPKDFDLSVDLDDMNKQLRNIRRAVLNQKNYDQRTVKAVSDLVRKMLNIGWGDGLSRGKVGNLLSAAKNATGANDVKRYLDKVMGILAENYLNHLSTAYDNLINTKGARADQSGVIKMGSLDAKGQAFMSEYKKAINMDDESLNNYIANIEEDSAKNEDNVEMNDYRLAGIQAAIMYKQQIGGNDADISELKRQIVELKNKKDATKVDKDLLKSLEKKLFENKFDRITMYENLLNNIQRMVKESKGRAKEFRDNITEHKNEILHRANLDLEGVDSTYYDTTTVKKKFVNNDLQRAVFSSTYTFEQFLKFFGKHSANGEGRLYNYFHKLNQDALDEEQLYNEMNRNALDEKTKELFGKEKFIKLVGFDGNGMNEMDIEVTDYSNKKTGKRTIHLKQGQMLYIYLVNKETDGEMKLRAMGITEEDVAAIEENLDPRVKAMGVWLQDEYLPECQRRYQATHTKYFGAPMKEVENYFPLAINNRARNVKEDVNQDSDAMSQLAGTSTGAIVTRRVNVIPLDIENADAFEVAFNHLQEMEEWSAMLPFRQDINTLLSYTHFRNQVQNMSSVAYGSGKTLWDEFKQTAQIAAGTYKPKVNAGMMDSRIAAAMGGIAVAKISGRLWTAIKQSQSATVFLPECDFTRFVKNGVNPYGSWKWAMENIPDFRKRVENMTYGDVKLRQYLDELEKWHDWTKTISKIGMAPNILVDGITCAVGARSVYETEVNRLTKLGYPKEKAEEKAYYKAVAAYNKTQQSSGGMYLSPMQVDRTYVSAALSLFKNANFAYGRMQIEACRGLARTYDFWGGKHKTTLIESMTRQIMEEDGLDENTGRAIAKATYNRTFRQSIGRLINFATLVPVSWALYKVLPYLLTGDDDDKKKDMIEEAVLKGFATSLSDNYVIPFASNILNAGLKVDDGKPTFDPEVFRYQNLYINPATSDLANIYSMVGNQKWYSVVNKLGMLGVQSLIGFNPETVGALYQAFSEADYDNGNTAKEWQIGILKAISAPEESIRELYMDELGLKSGDIKKIPLAELEKRYAERQINRDNLLSQIGMDAETFNGYVDKYQKSFEKKIKDKMDKWDEYDKKKADEFFDTTSDPKLRDMIEKKRTKDTNAAADEQIAKEGLNQEKKGKEPSEEAYNAVKMSIDVAEDNAISTYNKVLNKRYAALNDEYNEQTDAMKYIFMSKHPNFKAYKDLESKYTTYGKKMKELKEKLVSADGYDAKQTILKQIRAEREKFSELQSKVR